MQSPDSKLPFSATRVLRASKELSAAEKLVWLEIHALDRSPAGAWIGADALACRLGMHRDTVKGHRDTLKAIGLLSVLQQKRGESGGWLCHLPCECAPSGRRVDPDEVEERAAALDAHIRRHRGSLTPTPGSKWGSPGTEQTPTARVGVGAEPPPLPAQTRGNRGGPETPTNAPPLHPSILQLERVEPHPSPPPSPAAKAFSFADAHERPERTEHGNTGQPRDETPASCVDCGQPIQKGSQRCKEHHAAYVHRCFAPIKAAVEAP